jgi:hypothetical protein
MDENTLAHHSEFIVTANPTRAKSKLNLVPGEQLLYKRLVEERILLEQERIPVAF